MTARAPLSIRKLLLIAFLLVGLLPALLLSAVSFYQARQALRVEIKRDLQTTGRAVAEHVDRVLFERLQNVRSWSQLAVMQDMQIGDVDKRLSVFLQETRHSYASQYLSIDVIDTHGRIVASSNPANIGMALNLPPVWFSVAEKEQLLKVHLLQQSILMLSAPIHSDITGQTIGTLTAAFNWSVIDALLNHAAQFSTSLALTDHQQRILARSTTWAQQAHGLHASVAVNSRLPIDGWHIIVNKDHDVAAAPVHRLGLNFVLVLAIVIGLSLLILRPIAMRITLPLEALTQYVKVFRQHAAPPDTDTGSAEIRELHAAFSQMRHDLLTYEQQLTQAAKLAVVGEMAAAMSHEVRTPLGILRSSAEVLLREPSLTVDGKEVLGFIISETERLNKLVSGLIDTARPRLPNKIPLQLAEYIRHVLSLLQKQAEAKHITLLSRLDDNITISADQDQMTQVLLNLILNAIQILPEGGTVEISLQTEADHAIIQVADNGPGVPAGQQAHLFETFFSKRAGGVGLGLAVVKQIIEAHGGTISYTPSPWQGAQFNLTLPRD